MDDPKRPGGCTLVDHRGNEYIDLLGGFGIYSCGHSHPKIISAVQSQLTKQPLHSQELLDPLRAYCANILKKTLPGELGKDGFVFFTNSGTESVEACLKFAMLRTNRKNFIGVVGAFHGKTMGSLSGTSKAVFRKPFAGMGALLPFQHVKMNDCNALRAAFEASKFNGNEIAAFIVEPVIGEGGIHVCSNEFLQEARKLCTEYGALMICDG
jgi:putrescine aminotransferase